MRHAKYNDHRVGSILFLIPAFVGLIALMAGIGYCVINKSGHSGFDPRVAGMCFVPILLVAFILWKVGRKPEASLAATVGIFGFVFGFFVHGLGIMQSYEIWRSSGLPVRNPDSLWYLLSYAVLSILVMLVSYGVCRKSPDPGFHD